MPSPDYTAIYAWIVSRLQGSVSGVSNSTFDPDIASAIRGLLDPYTGQTYAGLSGNDKDNFEEAVGLVVAARLLSPYATKGTGATGYTIKSGDDSVSRQFGENASGLMSQWTQEAYQAFMLISFVKAAAPSLQLFALGGRRRSEVNQPPTNLYDLAFGEA
jgi:hypothetical protein